MKRFNKVFLLIICTLFLSCYVKAETYYLHIILNDGTSKSYALSDKPTLSFSNGSLVVDIDSWSTEIANISNWNFDQTTPTSIDENNNVQKIDYCDNVFTVSGVTTSDVKVYDIQGVNQSAEIDNSDNTVAVNLSNLPNGVYIIKIGTQSYKVKKQ